MPVTMYMYSTKKDLKNTGGTPKITKKFANFHINLDIILSLHAKNNFFNFEKACYLVVHKYNSAIFI